MTIQEYKCKTCGAVLDITQAVGGVVECPFCHNTYSLPKEDSDDNVRALLLQGEHDLDRNDFNGAYIAYDKARQLAPEEPEAYRGMALAECQVRYLQDTVNNRLQPICYLYDGPKISENENYKRAIKFATPEQKADYGKKAEDIDYIRNEFRKLRDSGEDYDCFLCVKVTESDGKTKTQDYRAADEIYDLLKRRGYSPFFSERTIQNKTGVDYEAEILYALYMCETMLVVCRDEKFLHTKWVQNEYMRFLKLVNDEEKESDSITTVFYGKPIERLPGRAGKLQGIDYSKPDAAVKILEFVENHTPRAKAKRQELSQKKEREAAEIRKQIEAQRQEFEKQQQLLQQELEGKLQRIQSVNVGNAGSTASVGSLLKRANQEMEYNNIPEARAYFNKVLDIDPENYQAWWGLFLLDNNVKHEDEIKKQLDKALYQQIENNRNYRSALNYSKNKSDSVAKRISVFVKYLRGAKTWWERFLSEMQVNSVKPLIENVKADKADLHAISHSTNLVQAILLSENADESTLRDMQELKQEIASYCSDSEEALSSASERLAALEKEKKEIERNISEIKSTIEELEVSKAEKTKKISLLYAAKNTPVRPDKRLIVFACIAAALFLASILLLVNRVLNKSNVVVIVFIFALPISLTISCITALISYFTSAKKYEADMNRNASLDTEIKSAQNEFHRLDKLFDEKKQQDRDAETSLETYTKEVNAAQSWVKYYQRIINECESIVNCVG